MISLASCDVAWTQLSNHVRIGFRGSGCSGLGFRDLEFRGLGFRGFVLRV